VGRLSKTRKSKKYSALSWTGLNSTRNHGGLVVEVWNVREPARGRQVVAGAVAGGTSEAERRFSFFFCGLCKCCAAESRCPRLRHVDADLC
jgi:hypothetical protein